MKPLSVADRLFLYFIPRRVASVHEKFTPESQQETKVVPRMTAGHVTLLSINGRVPLGRRNLSAILSAKSSLIVDLRW